MLNNLGLLLLRLVAQMPRVRLWYEALHLVEVVALCWLESRGASDDVGAGRGQNSLNSVNSVL